METGSQSPLSEWSDGAIKELFEDACNNKVKEGVAEYFSLATRLISEHFIELYYNDSSDRDDACIRAGIELGKNWERVCKIILECFNEDVSKLKLKDFSDEYLASLADSGIMAYISGLTQQDDIFDAARDAILSCVQVLEKYEPDEEENERINRIVAERVSKNLTKKEEPLS